MRHSNYLPMRSPLYPLLLGILALCLAGCMCTEVGDGSGTSAPDGKFRLAVVIDGAPRHAYIDKTKKKVGIWIETGPNTNSVTLFHRSYVLTGSDIEWKTTWSSPEAVSVEFYDWGDGVSNYNNMNHMTSSNHIALLSFVLDKNTGKYREKKSVR